MGRHYLKSQAAMEFVMLVGIALFMFLIMLTVVSKQMQDVNREEEIIRSEDVAIKIQKEINLAAKVMDGYYRRFYLPEKLGNLNYSIIRSGNELTIRTKNQDAWVIIPDIAGNITKRYNTINKTGGVIYLKNPN